MRMKKEYLEMLEKYHSAIINMDSILSIKNDFAKLLNCNIYELIVFPTQTIPEIVLLQGTNALLNKKIVEMIYEK